MAVLFVFAVLVLVTARALPAAVRGFRRLSLDDVRAALATWVSVGVFLALLLGYAVLTLALSSGQSARARVARRNGLAGGLAVGAAWLVIFSPGSLLKGLVIVPLACVLFGPACIAALTGHSTRDARTGTQAALWSGLVGGLNVFIVWVTATYLRNGRPYDPGLLRDFHNSGSPDLATYAVSDN